MPGSNGSFNSESWVIQGALVVEVALDGCFLEHIHVRCYPITVKCSLGRHQWKALSGHEDASRLCSELKPVPWFVQVRQGSVHWVSLEVVVLITCFQNLVHVHDALLEEREVPGVVLKGRSFLSHLCSHLRRDELVLLFGVYPIQKELETELRSMVLGTMVDPVSLEHRAHTDGTGEDSVVVVCLLAIRLADLAVSSKERVRNLML